MEFPTFIDICESEIDINSIITKITLPTTGAVVIFSGIVRGLTMENHRETTDLDYEVYRPMAEEKMKQISMEIRQHWPSIEGIAIVQRVGQVLPGTITTIIVCTSSHRNTGVFEGAHFGIERLKEIVPIWKKEIGPQGEEWVAGNYLPKSGE